MRISKVYQFGDQIALSREIDLIEIQKTLLKFEKKWSQYNPRKSHILREGLCVLNNTGRVGPGPALDSLREYNILNNVHIQESDCNIPTELYNSSLALQRILEGILPWCVRTHFLRLKPGGFFPPHRDHTYGEQATFRMLVPITNCNPPESRFIIEDKSLYWEMGRLYVVNTTKQHSLFNANTKHDSVWLLITVKLCDESIKFVADNLQQK